MTPLSSKNPSQRLRIIVTGYVVRLPLAGNVWCYLQYVLGLARLGHDVYFVEESGDSPYCCYDSDRNTSGTDPSCGARFTQRAFERFGLGDRWAYWDEHAGEWLGPRAGSIEKICRSADVLLRMPAMTDSLKPWLEEIPVRALIDHDPVFTQVRNLTDPGARRDSDQYTAYLSFGENIVRGTARVPDDGYAWGATRPPVVLDAWPVTPGRVDASFSTVLKWEAYRAVEFDGTSYGMKSASFAPFQELPGRVDAKLELAMGGGGAPTADLRRLGWSIRDPTELSSSLSSYQDYLQESKAEFSIAKEGYVRSRSGWLSERTGNYLACGRPALVQDTGFRDWLECGEGILAFSSPEEAAAGVEEITANYDRHCAAAREVAEAVFDSGKVLPRLLEDAFRLSGSNC
ncbi:MAG: glycosyltransferase family 1 protein [Akkermansiaceae bacterium]|nr:glycosyltransferase family 1 protein [Akkermansiaceae bacterium]